MTHFLSMVNNCTQYEKIPPMEGYCKDMISFSDMARPWADDLKDMGQGQKSLN